MQITYKLSEPIQHQINRINSQLEKALQILVDDLNNIYESATTSTDKKVDKAFECYERITTPLIDAKSRILTNSVHKIIYTAENERDLEIIHRMNAIN